MDCARPANLGEPQWSSRHVCSPTYSPVCKHPQTRRHRSDCLVLVKLPNRHCIGVHFIFFLYWSKTVKHKLNWYLNLQLCVCSQAGWLTVAAAIENRNKSILYNIIKRRVYGFLHLKEFSEEKYEIWYLMMFQSPAHCFDGVAQSRWRLAAPSLPHIPHIPSTAIRATGPSWPAAPCTDPDPPQQYNPQTEQRAIRNMVFK